MGDVDSLHVEDPMMVVVYTKGEASSDGSGGALWYAQKREWYDKEAIQRRFHYSWCALRRWDDDEVVLELETERELRQRKKAQRMERMLEQSTNMLNQLTAQSMR